jgi:hypothetical protein
MEIITTECIQIEALCPDLYWIEAESTRLIESGFSFRGEIDDFVETVGDSYYVCIPLTRIANGRPAVPGYESKFYLSYR